jgi:hypothetical protein
MSVSAGRLPSVPRITRRFIWKLKSATWMSQTRASSVRSDEPRRSVRFVMLPWNTTRLAQSVSSKRKPRKACHLVRVIVASGSLATIVERPDSQPRARLVSPFVGRRKYVS